MKVYNYIVLLLVGMAWTSCSDWLDLQPQDTTVEEDLFKTGEGYRNALNGIYKQMATSSMYGKELTWGALDAMAQYYRTGNGTTEDYFSDYLYNRDETKSRIKQIWSTSYNCIANCNNLIQRIEKAPVSLFAYGEEEKNLIWGEAKALRAILHFDILRLFAPGPKLDDGKKYIPYVSEYPITFQEYMSNKDVLKKITEDLLHAKQLVGKFDIPRALWLRTMTRFENDHQNIPEDNRPDDLFLAYRGYRLNYYAICGMLARVYSYREMYKEAYDETEIVLNATFDEYGSKLFGFTPSRDISDNGNVKMYDELLFCLSNQLLVTDYKAYRSTEPFALNCWDLLEWFDNDNGDARGKLLYEDGWDYYSSKYTERSGSYYTYAKDMIPMIRIGELYLIRAEYFNSIGNQSAAAEEFSALRRGHNCDGESVDTSSPDWFNTVIINEARREFLQEGQLFFYYKKLNVAPTRGFDTKNFVWPYPDNEIL